MSYQIAAHQTEHYQVNTEVYSGPLDLLLELIERAELDITRLALAQVTDQYLEYLRHLQQQNAAEVSVFWSLRHGWYKSSLLRYCPARKSLKPPQSKKTPAKRLRVS